ncbi:MAG TPA: hypothetical protein VES38_11600 [Methylotenera sp.]|nr:hypothetical protein [Methylotenera sp.]
MHKKFPLQERSLNRLALQIILGVTFPLLAQNVNAVEITKKAVIVTSAEYDSNPNLSEDEQSVWIYTLAPQFLVDVNSEFNRWFLDAKLLVQRHSNEAVLGDREDPSLTLGWDRTYESGVFGLKADYQETSSRTSELTSTGAFTNTEGTQKTKSLAGKWQHQISPRWSALTESAYSDVLFVNSGTLSGYTLSEIATKLTYAYTDRLNTNVLLGYALYKPDEIFDDTKLSRVIFGADYQVNEGLNVAGHAGVYNLSGQQSDTGLESGVKAGYTAESSYYTAELNRELVASGIGGFQKTDTFKLGYLYNRTENDRFGLDYGLSRARKDSNINIDWLSYQQLTAYYERNLSSKWLTRFSATHKELGVTGVRSRGDVIGVTFVYDTLSF